MMSQTSLGRGTRLLARHVPLLTVAFVFAAGPAALAAQPRAQNAPASPPAAQAKPPAKPQETPPPVTNAEPKNAGPGLISDFDDGKISANLGFGWTISTDSVVGGQSSADMKVVEGGAQGSKGALRVTGKIAEGAQYPWAGVMYSPGAQPFAPADLSSKKALAFWAKGDGRTYVVLLFTQSGGYMPAVQPFTPGPEWKEFRFPLSSFNGTDGHDVTAILFSAGPPAGDFSFAIDTVRLE
jgi:hypothetical protein